MKYNTMFIWNIIVSMKSVDTEQICTWREYEDVVGLKTDSSLGKDRLLVVPSEVYYFLHLDM